MLQSILQFFKLIIIYPFFYLSLIIKKSYKPGFDKIFFVLFVSLFVKYIDIFSYDEFLVGFIISSAVYVGSDFYLQSTFVNETAVLLKKKFSESFDLKLFVISDLMSVYKNINQVSKVIKSTNSGSVDVISMSNRDVSLICESQTNSISTKLNDNVQNRLDSLLAKETNLPKLRAKSIVGNLISYIKFDLAYNLELNEKQVESVFGDSASNKHLKVLLGTKDPKGIYSAKSKLNSNNIINSVLFSSKSKEWFALECPIGYSQESINYCLLDRITDIKDISSAK